MQLLFNFFSKRFGLLKSIHHLCVMINFDTRPMSLSPNGAATSLADAALNQVQGTYTEWAWMPILPDSAAKVAGALGISESEMHLEVGFAPVGKGYWHFTGKVLVYSQCGEPQTVQLTAKQFKSLGLDNIKADDADQQQFRGRLQSHAEAFAAAAKCEEID